MYDLGLLKNDARFKYHYAIKKIIAPNYNVVDIGANLGYFSKNFARLTPKGSVLSIEPVKPFYQVLKKLMAKFSHATVVNYALGNEKGTITMVMPESNGMIRTGLPHIAESEEEKKQHKTHEVEIVKGSELLNKIERIDYVKCDIEGYEVVVFEEIKAVIEQHKPIIQIEIGPENESKMFDYFNSLNYVQYGISNFKIVKENPGLQEEQGDFLFIHETKEIDFVERMKNQKLI